MQNIIKKEWVYRAVRTFIQTAVSSAAGLLAASGVTNLDALKSIALSVAISAVSAGIAAAMNIKPKGEEESE